MDMSIMRVGPVVWLPYPGCGARAREGLAPIYDVLDALISVQAQVFCERITRINTYVYGPDYSCTLERVRSMV